MPLMVRSLISVPSNAAFIPTRPEALIIPEHGLCLVLGGSKSGKSLFAEKTAETLAREEAAPLYYLATMEAGDDEENIARVERHRRQRRNKGYHSIEAQTKEKIRAAAIADHAVILLDCLGNWLANELFSAEHFQHTCQMAEDEKNDSCSRELFDVINTLAERSRALILVSNLVGAERDVDLLTRFWILELNRLHESIQACAQVIEVSAGCPLRIH